MSLRSIRGGRAEIEAVIRDKLGGGLRRLQRRLKSFAAGAAKVGGAAFGSATALLAPFAASVRKFLTVGDQLDKMSARAGESVENLSTLSFVANETGASIQDLEKSTIGYQRTIRNAQRALSTSKDALADIGLTAQDLADKSPADGIKLIADRLKTLDPNKRAALAMEIFGKAGQKILPMLSLGADGIENMQQRARDMGVEMSGKDASAAAELNDRLFELKEIVKATAIQIGAALAPTLIKIAEGLQFGAKFVLAFIKNNRVLVVGIVAGIAALGAFGAGMLTISVLAMGASAAIGIVIGTVKVLGAVLGAIFSPIGLVVVVVLALAGAILYFSGAGGQMVDFLKGKFSQLLAWGKKVFGGIYDAIAAGDWGLAGKIMWTALRVAWVAGIGWLMGKWLDFKFWFLNMGDLMVQGFRVGWQNAIDFVANIILWLIDQLNAASEVIIGSKLLDMDTKAIRKDILQQNKRFTDEVARGLLDRTLARQKAKQEALAKWDVTEIQAELDALIQTAKEKRENAAAIGETTGLTKDQIFAIATLGLRLGSSLQAAQQQTSDLQGEVTGSKSVLSTFSADVLTSFRASQKTEMRKVADAAEETADNTAEIVRLLEDGETGLVIT